jgi:multicomponent K+:H+ antiporter subunit D
VSAWMEHLAIVPILLPLAAGAWMLLLDEGRHSLKAGIGIASMLALIAVAIALLRGADAPHTIVYAVGDWAAPFGIVLVVDRLGAMMVLLAPVLGLAALVFSLARWHRAGPRFHSLVQFLMMGLNGAFLTGDLFNLFVFFELLLAASYGLALHGSGSVRVRASLHYIVVNLAASLLFLIGVSLMYGAAGTLNMADIATRIATIEPQDRALVEIGAAVLGVAFLVKAGMWPLGFWLPTMYAAATAPAAALFSILSKVGYAVIRLWLLLFGGAPGEQLLLYGGMATLAFGMFGVLGSIELSRIAGFSVLVSSGTILAAVGAGSVPATGAALFYLVVSTLGLGAYFLLIELVERARAPGASVLAVTAEAFGAGDGGAEPEEEPGVAIPATMAMLGLAFACCALVIAGLPPLSGFIAKWALMAAVVEPALVPASSWTLLALLVLSGLATIIAMGRAGVRLFWARTERTVPRVRVIEMAPVAALIALCAALTVAAGPALRYMNDTAAGMHAPGSYIEQVLPPR